MRPSRRSSRLLLCAAALGLAVVGPAAAGDVDEEALRLVQEAKARAVGIPEQAEALARLAWPDGGVSHPQASALARRQIVGFGDRGLEALRARFLQAPQRFQADIASAVMETRLTVSAGLPPLYVPALYDFVWFGSPEAKRLAMDELVRFRYPLATLAMMDAAHEFPSLTSDVVSCLGRQGDDRARFYLGGLLMGGAPEHRTAAAAALAAIGGRSIETLRDATLAPDDQIRGAAVDALIPVSSVDDLTILYEYVAQSPDDDPRRLDLVLQRAAQLEALLEVRPDVDSALPVEDH